MKTKTDFSANYKEKVIPALHESFDHILSEGKQHAVDWNRITFVGVEHNQNILTITFSLPGKIYHTSVQILELKGELYATRFIAFSRPSGL